MFKVIQNLRSSIPPSLIYTVKVIWFVLLILMILALAKYNSLKFNYWDGERKLKPQTSTIEQYEKFRR